MGTIKILGIDAAFANMGFARAEIDIQTMEIRPYDLLLVSTKPETKGKSVRVSSDNLRRARLLFDAHTERMSDVHMACAEVPSGAQSAKAAYGFGVAVGVLSSHSVPLIEVNPLEVKRAAVAKRTASKKEMIDWAYGLYPDLNWIRERGSKTGKLTNANEHLADALAIIHAAVKTEHFKSAVAMYRGIAAE